VDALTAMLPPQAFTISPMRSAGVAQVTVMWINSETGYGHLTRDA
jgi:hypothetical protein